MLRHQRYYNNDYQTEWQEGLCYIGNIWRSNCKRYFVTVADGKVTGRGSLFSIYPLIDVAPTNIKVYSYEKKKKSAWILRKVAAAASGGATETIKWVAGRGRKISKNTRIKIKFDLTNYGTKILRQKFMTKVSVREALSL